MPTYRGFVRSLQVRDDGWVELVLQAVHAGNATRTFFIRDLDGDITTAHKRLAHLSLLRDAIARVLPVEVEYDATSDQGDLIEDLTIHPRPSLDGRFPARRITGVVIGLHVAELGPLAATTPYTDAADVAGVTILSDDGTVEQVVLDLQRPDPDTAQAMLDLLDQAHRTRRPVSVFVDEELRRDDKKYDVRSGSYTHVDVDANATSSGTLAVVQAVEWITVPEETLDYVYAFVERLGQRYESYESDEAPALSRVRVLYTTAPGQTPEGDVSDNGSFAPQTSEAWVHDDSPLLARLEAALRDRLQVKLGLLEREVHEVEMVGHLGSAARPIWIRVESSLVPIEPAPSTCENVPTIQLPTASDLERLPVAVSWRGLAYFNEGIWRFVVRTGADARLLVDGEPPCCDSPAGFELMQANTMLDINRNLNVERTRASMCHAYLDGLHRVELILSGRTCSQPFQFQVYRIR